jgi:general secretion pathway protein A
MYTAHFGLRATPFSITPDPRYLYLSDRHREALAHLVYGVNEGSGFVVLTGEVGTGKTTLCRCLIEQLPDTVDVALLLNPRLNSRELLATIFDELRVAYDTAYTLKDFIDILNTYLLTAHAVGRRTVLILDEAQNLSTEVLEEVRLLTNLETARQKLLQIILVGQPELNTLLKKKNLRQLAQRVTARYHLLPLSLKDTYAYINHRLAVSGASMPLFQRAAIRKIYRYSGGIPRLINVICDRALLGGYVNNRTSIDTVIVRKAVLEVQGENLHYFPYTTLVGILLVILLIFIGIRIYFPHIELFKKDIFSFESEQVSEISVSNSTAPKNTVLEKVESSEVKIVATLQDILHNTTISHDMESSFTTLFAQWQLNYAELTGATACERASKKGLTCLHRTGSWEDIRRLNRPAVIELVTNGGKQYHTVIKKLTGEKATLDFSGKTFDFSLHEINNYWLGQFLLLWQPPSLPISSLKIGMNSKDVIWVHHLLNIHERMENPNSETVSPRFDQTLKNRIMEFQRYYGLEPDGVIGEQTLLMLSTLSKEQPSLR